MDPALLSRMHAHIDEHVPGLHGLLIVRHGYLVFEQYFQGFHRHSYNSISYAAFFASGFGSKLIYVIPALDLVIVTIASTENAVKNPNQHKDIIELVPRFILPATIEKH